MGLEVGQPSRTILPVSWRRRWPAVDPGGSQAAGGGAPGGRAEGDRRAPCAQHDLPGHVFAPFMTSQVMRTTGGGPGRGRSAGLFSAGRPGAVVERWPAQAVQGAGAGVRSARSGPARDLPAQKRRGVPGCRADPAPAGRPFPPESGRAVEVGGAGGGRRCSSRPGQPGAAVERRPARRSRAAGARRCGASSRPGRAGPARGGPAAGVQLRKAVGILRKRRAGRSMPFLDRDLYALSNHSIPSGIGRGIG